MRFDTALARLNEQDAAALALLPGLLPGLLVFGLFLPLGGLVAAAIASPSTSAADPFSVPGIGGVAIGFASRGILQDALDRAGACATGRNGLPRRNGAGGHGP